MTNASGDVQEQGGVACEHCSGIVIHRPEGGWPESVLDEHDMDPDWDSYTFFGAIDANDWELVVAFEYGSRILNLRCAHCHAEINDGSNYENVGEEMLGTHHDSPLVIPVEIETESDGDCWQYFLTQRHPDPRASIVAKLRELVELTESEAREFETAAKMAGHPATKERQGIRQRMSEKSARRLRTLISEIEEETA